MNENLNINNIIQKLKGNHIKGFHYYNEKGKKVTKEYNDIYNDVLATLVSFEEVGILKGDRVGIIAKTSYEWVVVDLACIYKAVMTVPFDNNKVEDIEGVIKEYELKYVFTDKTENGHSNRIIDFKDLISLKSPTKRLNDIPPETYDDEEPFTMIFTSGTSGKEKAIEVKSKTFNDLTTNTQKMFKFDTQDNILIFLPLHIYLERCFIYMGILLDLEVTLTPTEYLFKSIKRDMPTIIIGIPYFFENLANLFLQDICQNRRQCLSFKLYKLVKKIGLNFLVPNVFPYFKKFWGGKIRYLISGSAPCKIKMLEFYNEMGVPVYEGYGMSEIGGLLSLNFPGNMKIGSVGKVFPNKEIKFDSNNQILITGKNIANSKYYRAGNGDNEKTFLPDSWLATGDTGYFDHDGYLHINGRIKDDIVMSSGIKVQPSPIEKKIDSSKLINSSVVIGDDRAHLVALISPIDKKIQQKLLDDEFIRINKILPKNEKIRQYYILEEDLSPFNGTLTSAFKLNRKFISEKYKNEINDLYI